jgi:NADH-ubiquinone oxidoreductase chain 1
MIFFFSQKLFIGIILFILILSETSRIPFDFIEGESELVSGFNIEYSSSYFSLFFIYEYGIMLFFCLLISLIFSSFICSFILILFFILIRSAFPRFRYDQIIIFI